ncbi:M48 family metalloprotease [Thalassotalea maritima]|uniref:beta-barrel assembly-enhancing protease n=1 Tax=Thalassotalea maritima TaxID=3242416 RepID=UPI003526D15E
MNKFFSLKPLTLACLCVATTASAIGLDDDKNALPEIGTAAVSTLSLDKERLYGDAMMRSIRASQPVIYDPVLDEYINDLGNRLVQQADDAYYQFNFFMLNQKDINAFAFFGGNVGIHSSLMLLADDESELAAVIAHEIAHVTQRHLARRIEAQSRNSPMTIAGVVSGVLLALINPQMGMAALSTTLAATQQMGINYTRSNEKEADRVGMDILVASDFDPNGAPNFFRKMAGKSRYSSKPPAFLLTHPLPESRIADSRTRANRYPDRAVPASLKFELAKARLKVRYSGTNARDNITSFQDILYREKYQVKQAAEYGLALSYFENKDYQKAYEIVATLMKQQPHNLFYVDTMSDILLAQEKYSQALAMLQDLALIMPYNQVVTLNYANIAYKAKQYKLAENLLQDFLMLNKEHFLAHDLLSSVYQEQQKSAQMHMQKAELMALMAQYPRAVDELHTAYNFASDDSLTQKRIKARILQFQEKENELKRF